MDTVNKVDLIDNSENLTELLLRYSLPSYMIENNKPIADTEIWRFLMRIFAVEGTPYFSICINLEDGIVQYNLSDLQRVAYEVFGIDAWFYDPDGSYDETNQIFTVNPAQGLFQGNYISDIHTAIVDNTHVKTEFIVSYYTNHNGDPELCEMGLYQCTYEIINENGSCFLRLDSYGMCK